jgi:hypothetical protein
MYNHPATSQQLSQAYSSITNNINSSTHKIENSIKSSLTLNKSLFDRNLKESKGYSNYNTTRVLRDLALFKEEIQNTLVALAKAQHTTNVALLDIKKLLRIELEDSFPDKTNIKVLIGNNNGKNVGNTSKDDSSVYYSS